MRDAGSLRVMALLGVGLLATAVPRQAGEPLLGFSQSGSARQRELEGRFDGLVRAENLESWMRQLSSRPNHVGAPHNLENAEWMVARFREWGYTVRIDTFQVLFPTPTDRLLEMVAPTRFRARLTEPTLSDDATSRITDGRLPPYNAYSADGDVTAELVYVNYGVPDDYEELDRRGISVDGRIVIARYGGSWRGIKPKVAAEHGAVGCIIYSDPRDDGYWRGDVYPQGAYRMEYGAQRGSVADMPTYPGDPLTPGVGATPDADRYTVEESPTVMKIPVLPISYADAQPLLAAMAGPVAPASWRGALPLTYHVGPGPARVHLRVSFDWSLRPAYDVIARMEGAVAPDEWVVRGNHRDGWVFGAADPLSGMVALLEEARVVGRLARDGWRPRRTIVYASWDAEEPGLLGSTEWVEYHAAELNAKAVAYVNTDGTGRGYLTVGGAHSLERLVNQVARDVRDPFHGVSVWERRRELLAVRGDRSPADRSDLDIYPLGSGSDYTPFLQHLGVASLNVGYGGEGGGGSYHSIFDSFDYYRRFGDPGFRYGVAQVQTTGRLTTRLADAEVLPFRFGGLVAHLDEYVDEVEQLADDLRAETERRNALIADSSYARTSDPTDPVSPPAARDPVPFINLAPVRNAFASVETAARRYDSLLAARAADDRFPTDRARDLNRLLIQTERVLTDDAGLPRRPWFRHQIYAPGFYTGYGVKTLPGIREGIEERHWDEVETMVGRVAAALTRLAGVLDRASALLSG